MIIKVILIIIMVFLASCGKTELTPEEARKELAILNIQYNEGSFYDAITNNDNHILKLLLKAGMSPNTVFTIKDKGATPLILAAYKNNTELVRLLVEKGADINYKCSYSSDGQSTALYYAIILLNYENCKLLLEKGARTHVMINDKDIKAYEILKSMINNGSYLTLVDGKKSYMNTQEKDTANKILELLGKYADNDLIKLSGKVNLSATSGWCLSTGDNPGDDHYLIGEGIPGAIGKLFKKAENGNMKVTVVGEIYRYRESKYDKGGEKYYGTGIRIVKIEYQGESFSMPR